MYSEGSSSGSSSLVSTPTRRRPQNPSIMRPPSALGRATTPKPISWILVTSSAIDFISTLTLGIPRISSKYRTKMYGMFAWGLVRSTIILGIALSRRYMRRWNWVIVAQLMLATTNAGKVTILVELYTFNELVQKSLVATYVKGLTLWLIQGVCVSLLHYALFWGVVSLQRRREPGLVQESLPPRYAPSAAQTRKRSQAWVDSTVVHIDENELSDTEEDTELHDEPNDIDSSLSEDDDDNAIIDIPRYHSTDSNYARSSSSTSKPKYGSLV